MLLYKIVLFIFLSFSMMAWVRTDSYPNLIFNSDEICSQKCNSLSNTSIDYVVVEYFASPLYDCPAPTPPDNLSPLPDDEFLGWNYDNIIFQHFEGYFYNIEKDDGKCVSYEGYKYKYFIKCVCSKECEDGLIWDRDSNSCSCPSNSHYDASKENCICDTGYFRDANNSCIKYSCPPEYNNNPLIAQDITSTACVNAIGSSIGDFIEIDTPSKATCCYGMVCDANSSYNFQLKKCVPICKNINFIYDLNLSKCIPNCLDNQVYDNDLSRCISRSDACRYPLIISRFSFQYTTEDRDSCDRDIYLYGGGNFLKKESCQYGACYFNLINNGELNSSNDANNSSLDANNSYKIDTNKSSDNLNSSINTQIRKSSDDIIRKLDEIEKSNSKNMNKLSEKVDNINKTLNPDLTNNEELKRLDRGLNSVKDAYSSIFDTFKVSKNDFFSIIDKAEVPSIKIRSETDKCKYCFNIFGGKACIDLSAFSQFRPFLLFILNIFLLYLMIKIYIAIARDIAKYFLGGN